MRRTLIPLLLMLAVQVSAGGAWGADLELPPGKWWEDSRLVERVQLTEAQQADIRRLVFEHARRMIDLHAVVKRSELELAEVVDRQRLQVAEVRRAFAAFQDARRALEQERFELMLAIRQVLSREQWDRLQDLRKDIQRRRGDPPERPVRPRGGPGERPPGPPGR